MLTRTCVCDIYSEDSSHRHTDPQPIRACMHRQMETVGTHAHSTPTVAWRYACQTVPETEMNSIAVVDEKQTHGIVGFSTHGSCVRCGDCRACLPDFICIRHRRPSAGDDDKHPTDKPSEEWRWGWGWGGGGGVLRAAEISAAVWHSVHMPPDELSRHHTTYRATIGYTRRDINRWSAVDDRKICRVDAKIIREKKISYSYTRGTTVANKVAYCNSRTRDNNLQNIVGGQTTAIIATSRITNIRRRRNTSGRGKPEALQVKLYCLVRSCS